MMERVFLSLSEERNRKKESGGVRPMIFLGLFFTRKNFSLKRAMNECGWFTLPRVTREEKKYGCERGRERDTERDRERERKNEWTKMCLLSHTPHISFPQDSTSFSSHFSSKHPHPSNLEGGILSWDWRKLVEKLKLLKVIHSISFLSCHSLPPRELFNYFPSPSSLK